MRKPAKLLFSTVIASFLFLWPSMASGVLAASAVLKLSPASGTITEGETLEAEVQVDTGGAEVGAVDVIIRFDASLVGVTVDDSDSVFDVVSISGDLGDGEIDVSAFMASGDDSVSGSGRQVFGLSITALTGLGAAVFDFDFTLGGTRDCNVLEMHVHDDILGTADDVSYALAAAEGDSTLTPTPTSTSVPTSTPTSAPASDPTSTPTPGGSGSSGSDSSSTTATATPADTSGGTEAVTGTPATGNPVIATLVNLFGFILLLSGIFLAL